MNAFSTIKTRSSALKFFFRRSNRAFLTEDGRWRSFMKGVFRLSPPPLPTGDIWNPDIIINLVEHRSSRPTSFLEAAREALILLLLASALRVDDALKLSNNCQVFHQVMRLHFSQPRKCPKRNVPIETFLLKKFSSERACPVSAISHYQQLAAKIRLPGQNQLFISSKGRNAAKQTLQRWVGDVLRKAGIVATAGSCRSAASSHAENNGVSIPTILASAGWQSESVFRKHYSRPVLPASCLLNSDRQ